MRLFFCFNDTATTESYTYLHTLSLHDALPISFGGNPMGAAVARVALRKLSSPEILANVAKQSQALREGLADIDRSEEHTSELQSLMRISYAVFCLKKQTT